MPSHVRASIAAGIALALLPGCAAAAPTPGPRSPATVVVFAAASLRGTFTALGQSFETNHPGVTVRFSFAGSHALAEQLLQGAQADVFAAADEATMAPVTAAGLAAGQARPFATNRLVIVVPPDNPAAISSLADLTAPGLKLVRCAPEVPCGAAAAKVERAAGLTLAPVSEEQAVSDVLAKVQAGEADAGLVYATDALAAGSTVRGIAFPEAANAINTNTIAALKSGSQPGLAREFVDLVHSAAGRRLLVAAGFGEP